MSANVKAFRQSKNWTQEELASAAESSQPVISRIENGQQAPTTDLAKALVRLSKGGKPALDFEALMTMPIAPEQPRKPARRAPARPAPKRRAPPAGGAR